MICTFQVAIVVHFCPDNFIYFKLTQNTHQAFIRRKCEFIVDSKLIF